MTYTRYRGVPAGIGTRPPIGTNVELDGCCLACLTLKQAHNVLVSRPQHADALQVAPPTRWICPCVSIDIGHPFNSISRPWALGTIPSSGSANVCIDTVQCLPRWPKGHQWRWWRRVGGLVLRGVARRPDQWPDSCRGGGRGTVSSFIRTSQHEHQITDARRSCRPRWADDSAKVHDERVEADGQPQGQRYVAGGTE